MFNGYTIESKLCIATFSSSWLPLPITILHVFIVWQILDAKGSQGIFAFAALALGACTSLRQLK